MTTESETEPKAADVISKTRGQSTTHYLIGPQRATREEAERDLRDWHDTERLRQGIVEALRYAVRYVPGPEAAALQRILQPLISDTSLEYGR